MNSVSSSNSLYLYELKNSADTSPQTFLRRLSKRNMNFKSNFVFDTTSWTDSVDVLKTFLNSKYNSGDWVFCNVNLMNIFTSNAVSYFQFALVLKSESDFEDLTPSKLKIWESLTSCIILSPKNKTQLIRAKNAYKTLLEHTFFKVYWRLSPALTSTNNESILPQDVFDISPEPNGFPGLEIKNLNVPENFELQPEFDFSYQVKMRPTEAQYQIKPKLSVIIPTFNNAKFVTNVIYHLKNQKTDCQSFEIIVCDDGSQDDSFNLIEEFFPNHKTNVPLTYIYWPKLHPTRGDQNFFRPGLARNLATKYARGEFLFFLDSDMLVPEDFVSLVLTEFENSDIVQFQRYHVRQSLSQENPSYSSIRVGSDTYIEEHHYWSQLFFAKNWQNLPDYWKYTCTYALGISKSKFIQLGMFKKYFISYGFEDTDLGYEAFKQKYKFSLVKTPLMHLTSYSQQQYNNSAIKRRKLLSITAELFYLQHLDSKIYNLLGDFLKRRKGLVAILTGLVNQSEA